MNFAERGAGWGAGRRGSAASSAPGAAAGPGARRGSLRPAALPGDAGVVVPSLALRAAGNVRCLSGKGAGERPGHVRRAGSRMDGWMCSGD